MDSDTKPLTPPSLPKNGRFIIFIYLFGAPALLMLADGLHYYHHYLIANVIFKTALVAFIVGSFGITYLFPKSEKYFGLTGTGLIALGSIMIAGMSTEILYQDMLADKGYKISDIKEFEQLLQSTEAMRVIFLPTGFAFPLGLVILGIGIFKTPYTPRSISIILCAGSCFKYFNKSRRGNMSSYWEKVLNVKLNISYLDIENNCFEKNFEIKYRVTTMAMPAQGFEPPFCSFQIVSREI